MMRTTGQCLALALSFVLVGCVSSAVSIAPQGETVSSNHQQAPQKAPVYGLLRVSVRWPQKYYSNTIPLSTDAFVLEVRNSNNLVTNTETISKSQGSTALLKILPGNNYSLKVSAYRNYNTADQVLVASAYAPAINIQPAKTTQVPLDLAPLYVPTISSLSSNVLKSGFGGWFQINGNNFGTGSVWVTLNGATQSAVPDSSSSVTVNLTTGHTVRSGYVNVTADGVKSENSAFLWVFDALTASASSSSMAVGQEMQLVASPSWVLDGPIPDGQEAPLASWESLSPAIATITETGLLRAVGTGIANVRAKLRDLYYSNELSITVNPAVQVQNVTIRTPAVSKIYAPPADGAPSAEFTGYAFAVNLTADVAAISGTPSGVDWSVSSNRLVELLTIDASTVQVKAIAQPFSDTTYENGTVTVTAVSKDDPTKSHAIILTVEGEGGLNVTLH